MDEKVERNSSQPKTDNDKQATKGGVVFGGSNRPPRVPLIDEKRAGLWSQVFEQEGIVLLETTNRVASTFSAIKKQKENFCGMRTINPEF